MCDAAAQPSGHLAERGRTPRRVRTLRHDRAAGGTAVVHVQLAILPIHSSRRAAMPRKRWQRLAVTACLSSERMWRWPEGQGRWSDLPSHQADVPPFRSDFGSVSWTVARHRSWLIKPYHPIFLLMVSLGALALMGEGTNRGPATTRASNRRWAITARASAARWIA